MGRVLHIDSSPRGDGSHTRRVSGELVRAWVAAHPGDAVVRRDVGRDPLPHVTDDWVGAAFSPPEARTPAQREAIRLSDELVDELLAADLIVAGVPMYNFGVPSGFKAWIDQVVRVGRTFAYDPSAANPYVPLVHGKRLVAVTAAGGAGYGPGGWLAQYNHLHPYLRAVFGFMGVTDVQFVEVENASGGPALDESLAAARAKVAELARAA